MLLTIDEVDAMWVALARDPAEKNECDCHSGMPGVLAPCLPDGEASHNFIERCDLCQKYPDDTTAAEAFAELTGLNVHKRYDDEKLDAWRPFVTRSGDDDDHDYYGVGGNEFGCHPTSEVLVQ